MYIISLMAKKNRIEKFIHNIKKVHKDKKIGAFFISAPSAAGKDGLWRYIHKMGYDKKYDLHRCISTTTRYPREGETCGVDYFFLPAKCLIDENGKFQDFCLNPVTFGVELDGSPVYYCFTKQQIDGPLKNKKSIFLNVYGTAVDFYKNYIKKHFPHVKIVTTVWTISPEEQRKKFFRREPEKTPQELEKLFQARSPERKLYDDLIALNTFDHVESADVLLHDWKHEQYKKLKKKKNK